MAIPTLSGSYIDETYGRLVQVSGSEFADGDGNAISFGGGAGGPINSIQINKDGTNFSGSANLTFVNNNIQLTGSIFMSGSSYISGVDYIDFDTTASNAGAVARLKWNDADGTLDLGLKGGNVTLQVGQETVLRVVNKTATNITLLEANYQAVRLTGAQGQRLKVDLAQATSDSLSAETLGLVTETIANNQEGFITTSGLVRGINTTGALQGESWADGDVLYLSPTTAGRITNIKPVAPNHLVIIGYVVHTHQTQGSIFVKVDNGYEIDELHNVLINTGSLTPGQLLVRSGSVWINSTQLTGSYGLTGSLIVSAGITGSLSGSVFGYVANTQTGSFITSAQTGSFATTGSNVFRGNQTITGSFSQSGSSATFIGNVGIGNVSPTARLHVGTSTSFLKVTNNWLGGNGTWIDLSLDGPSGIGSGGPGANPFFAYVSFNGAWFTNSQIGDIAYRNGGGKLLFGNTGGNAGMTLSGDNLGIGTVSPAYKLDVNGNARFANNLAVEGSINMTGSADTTVFTSNANTLVITGSLIQSGSVYLSGLTSATQTYVVGINNSTGQLYKQPAGGGGGGSVNPTSTYIPFNNDGVFVDSYLNQSGSVLKTISASIDRGLQLDFANNIYSLGNPDDGITMQNGSYSYGTGSLFTDGFGLGIDWNQKFVKLGDYGGINNSTTLIIDDTAEKVTINKHLEVSSGSIVPYYTVTGISTLSSTYDITASGIFEIVVANGSITFPDPSIHDGQTIFVINNDSSYGLNIDNTNTYAPFAAGTNTQVGTINVEDMYHFISIGGKWRGIKSGK